MCKVKGKLQPNLGYPSQPVRMSKMRTVSLMCCEFKFTVNITVQFMIIVSFTLLSTSHMKIVSIGILDYVHGVLFK